ncbi:23S rRNA (uracil(1939)-C(5))-methyltransferase RlmD [Clostridium autoethanogenum]|uniref:23S rRNA (Uracil(1939)-C(5))-methyltransferase RlmD n=1 Tax=Clostridium autoethanogenum DSM 10061 TaxID=1341692 RepID=A0ABM5NXL8_9CLOT|nr:23S rRNA (uracil(1939)-C(5))-methyltransferase RlmD [Clostridium autoethanogenum]AGY77174.1 23S rRNA (uracil(1939)-C(5))-methyltransferase RlmD [Clostridium autoethanogenum DSM 10061]ALU37315.1 RNA methyltransferase TrmA family [Clostridium autoethanogenum DSM 10061]OVY50117.1 23S rRNA (uracil-C(5))-methyltransferase RlmCD [Clostridium autoethanogenum]
MKKGSEYEFFIEELQFPAIGIAKKDDMDVLIKNTVPGQKVKARITKKTKHYLEAKVTEILENVNYAVDPFCPHFNLCGGCTSQFIPYDKQLELKEKQVLDLFEKASICDFEFLGIEKSPEKTGYRNKMEFSFGDEQRGGQLTLGMHIKGRSFGVVNVDNCNLVDADFTLILDKVVTYFREKNLPYYKIKNHEGYLRNLVLRKGRNTGEILINIVTTSQIQFDLDGFNKLLQDLNYKGTLVGILHTVNDNLSDMVKADKVEILYGRDYIIEEILGLKFKISPESFFQTNSRGTEKLYSIIKDFLGDVSSKTVFDLYCGTGTIGQVLASSVNKVIGVELIEKAVASANENARLNNIKNCRFIAGDVKDVLNTLEDKPGIIILDPPRPGVHPKALKYVIDFNAPEIIYVSCNPKTLVQDLNVLIDAGYNVDKVKLMDMFPHTPHVETVVKLSK